MHKYQKGFAPIMIALIVLVLAGVGGGSYYLINKINQNNLFRSDNRDQGKNQISEKFLYIYTPQPDKSDKVVYLFDVSSKQQTELPIGKQIISACLNDGELYYSNGSSILSYNFQKNSSEAVSNAADLNNENILPYNFTYLSPNCHYAILDSGTSTGNRGRGLYNVESGKSIDISNGMDVIWSPDSNKFVLVSGTIDFWTGADETLNSIYLEVINGDKVKENLILPATKKENYKPIKWISSNILMYEKDTFSSPIKSLTGTDSEFVMNFNKNLYNNRKIEYFTINVDTMDISSADKVLEDNANNLITMISPLGDYQITINENGNNYLGRAYYDINLSKNGDDSSKFLVTSKHFNGEFITWLPISDEE